MPLTVTDIGNECTDGDVSVRSITGELDSDGGWGWSFRRRPPVWLTFVLDRLNKFGCCSVPPHRRRRVRCRYGSKRRAFV